MLRRLAGGVAALMVGLAAGKMLAFAADAVLGRALGPGDYGHYGSAIALLAVGLVISSAGLDLIAIRELVRNPQAIPSIRRHIRRIRLRLGGIVGVCIGAGVLANVVPRNLGVPLALVPIVFAFREDWVLIAIQRERFVAVAGIVRDIVFLGAVGVALGVGVTIGGAAWAFLVAETGWAAATQVLVHRVFIRSAAASDDQPSPIMTRDGIPLATSALMALGMNRLGIPIVSLLSGVAAAGLYFASYRIVAAVVAMMQPLSRVALPALSAASSGPAMRVNSGDQMLAIAASVGGLAAAILYFVARALVPAVYGRAFEEAGIVLRILCLGVAFSVPAAILLQGLIASGNGGKILQATSLGACANIVLLVALVPVLAAMGAALAAAVAEGVMLLSAMVLSRGRSAIRRLDWVSILPSIVVLPACLLCSRYMPDQDIAGALITLALVLAASVLTISRARNSELYRRTIAPDAAGS